MQRRDITSVLVGAATGAALLPRAAQSQTCTAPCYPRTAAETAAGITPANSTYAPRLGYDVRRYDSSGGTNYSAAINSAQAANAQVYFPPGTYRIQNSVTVNPDVTLVFDAGAVLSIDLGVIVMVLGQIEAGSHQIFSGPGKIGTSPYYQSPGRWNVKWWGAKGDTSTDDTAAINAALAAVVQGTLYFPAGGYALAAIAGVSLPLAPGPVTTDLQQWRRCARASATMADEHRKRALEVAAREERARVLRNLRA